MPQKNARQTDDGGRDAGTRSAREALEHPHMLFRFQRDPLDVAMRSGLAAAEGKPAARQAPKRQAK